jgi:hypothetical protein
MRRLLGLLVVVGLALLTVAVLRPATSALAATDLLAIESIEMEVGQSAPVSLSALHLKDTTLSWTIDIEFDPDIVSAVRCDSSDKSACTTSFGPHTVRVTGSSKEGISGDYVIAALSFRCDAVGTSDLTIQPWAFVGPIRDPQVIQELDLQHGSVTCVAASQTSEIATTTPTITLPPTGSTANDTDNAWPFAALAAFGAIALLAGAAVARRQMTRAIGR